MSLKILQGGTIRYPFDATTSGTGLSSWYAGQLCEVDPTTLKLVPFTGSKTNTGAFRVSGIVIDEQETPSTTLKNTVNGSGKASLLLNEAVVQVSVLALAGSASWKIGDLVYGNTSGLLTNSASVAKIFGQALSASSQAAGDSLTLLYAPILA